MDWYFKPKVHVFFVEICIFLDRICTFEMQMHFFRKYMRASFFLGTYPWGLQTGVIASENYFFVDFSRNSAKIVSIVFLFGFFTFWWKTFPWRLAAAFTSNVKVIVEFWKGIIFLPHYTSFWPKSHSLLESSNPELSSQTRFQKIRPFCDDVDGAFWTALIFTFFVNCQKEMFKFMLF